MNEFNPNYVPSIGVMIADILEYQSDGVVSSILMDIGIKRYLKMVTGEEKLSDKDIEVLCNHLPGVSKQFWINLSKSCSR